MQAPPPRPPNRSEAALPSALRRCEPPDLGSAEMRVLHDDEDFIIVDKPPDVRMDGDFDVTVEKLVAPLLAADARPDGGVKWVHQLDFATSGVLAVARHRDAARRAHELFASRLVEKEYVAVVEGDVDVAAMPPCPSRAAFDTTVAGFSADLSAAAACKKRKRAVQFKPACSFFEQHCAALRKRKAARAELTAGEEHLLTLRWKDVKRDATLRGPFDAQANADKERVEASVTDERDAIERLGGVYRHPGFEGDGSAFVVDAPLASVPGDFRMQIASLGSNRTDARADAKPSLTEAFVIGRGVYRGRAVTKLRLHPVSGRRHQLRLHMVQARYPIVGDATCAV